MKPNSFKTAAQNVTPVAAKAPAAPAERATSDSLRLRYASNPYRNTMRALGIIFQTNPLTTLTITPLLLVAALVLVAPGALVMGLVSEPVGAAVFGVGLALWLTLMVAAAVKVQSASYHGEQLTGREVLRSIDKNRLPGLFGLVVLSYIAVVIGFVLLVIPGITLLARLSLAAYIFHDEKVGAIKSLKRSWELTRGHTWELLGSYVAQMLIIGSSGGLLTFVGSSASFADRYYTLKAHAKAKVPTGPTHYSNYLSVILLIVGVVGYFGSVAFLVGKGVNDIKNEMQQSPQTQMLQGDPFTEGLPAPAPDGSGYQLR